MQIPAREHFEQIVLPAIDAYKNAEKALTVDGGEKAKFLALREGAAAALFLHHFSDIVAKRPPPGLPEFEGKTKEVRKFLEARSEDANLLGDIADALKHAVLTQHLPREVEESGQVLVVGRSFGTGRYGEGKFGGADEVWVLSRSGKRSLSSVLKSVSDAWKSILVS